MISEKWDRRFLRLAQEIAGWSKDPSSKVGALAVKDRRVLATGFNGFPIGMADDDRMVDREQKYPRIVHAEENVIAHAARVGMSLYGATLYVAPYHPCIDCAKIIVQSGIGEVVFAAGNTPDRWATGFGMANHLFRECGVTVREVWLQ